MSGLSRADLAIVEAIVDRLIPSDDTGPGAREACVGRYIDLSLQDAYGDSCETYRSGLAAIESHCRNVHGGSFVELATDAQDAVLERVEAGALGGSASPPPGFFALIRQHAIEGMFCDPRWGGNAERIGWKLIGYPGPKAVWTAAEQDLDYDPARPTRGEGSSVA